MTDLLNERLNQILRRVTEDEFLSGGGIGNEIPIYIFDYPAEDELRVRDFIKTLLVHIPKQNVGLTVMHVNLFDMVVNHLSDRGYLDRSIEMQRSKGNAEVSKALSGMLTSEKLAAEFVRTSNPDDHDLFLISGVGSAYPIVRTNAFLTGLHKFIGRKPVVLFYPGKFDEVLLRLFGKLRLSSTLGSTTATKKEERYYRAIKLLK